MGNVVNLTGIKEAIRAHLETCNATTTAQPVYLSNGMTKPIAKVYKVHPDYITIQNSHLNCVTCYITGKTIVRDDIAGSQLNSKRRATIDIDVIGMVFNQNIALVTEDPADEDINKLMENIELAMRAATATNITGLINFQVPSGITYYTQMNAQTHLRAGILSLKATVHY